MANKKEEITDILTAEGIRSGEFAVGQALKFSTGVTIKITKIDKKNGRAWGEHVVLTNGTIVATHDGHDVTGGGPGDLPYCKDCKVNIDEPSTEDGEVKAKNRKDTEDEQLQTA